MTDRRRRGRFATIVVAVAAVILSGCTLEPYPEIPRFADSGGQTQAELDATLADIPNLTFTNAAGSQPNIKGNTGYVFDITLEQGYEIADVPALIDFLVKSAWSVRDGYMPNTTVEIHLDAGPLPSDKVDVVAAAEDAGWVPIGSQSHRMTPEDGGSAPEFDNGSTSLTVWIDIDRPKTQDDSTGSFANRERLGDWPGAVPKLPDGLVVPVAARP